MRRRTWTLIALVLSAGAVFLDGTLVSVALPRMGRELPHTVLGLLEGQSDVYNGYLLTLSALLIPMGAVGDRLGHRTAFIWGACGFGAASLLCGLAPSLEFEVGARVLQGVAGALLVPLGLALIRSSFPGAEQPRAFGTWAAASSATTLLGPLLGGILVDTVSWRAAFLINLPILACALYCMVRGEAADSPTRAPVDWIGSMLTALACGGLVFGLVAGQQRSWRGGLPFLAVGLGLAAAAALPFWLLRATNPLVPPRLFRLRDFTITNLTTLIVWGSLYVSGYYLVLFLQGVAGYTAAAAGVASLPVGILLTVLSAPIGRAAGRFGPRWFLAAGPALMGVSFLWLTRIPATTAPWRLRLSDPSSLVPPGSYLIDVLPEVLGFGVGLAIVVAPLTTTLMRSVPAENGGVASAFNNAITRVGAQLAGAAGFVVTVVAFRAVAPESLAPFARPAGASAEVLAVWERGSTDAFHVTALLCAGLFILGALINAVGIRGVPVAEATSP